jgi:hypothetical protein
MSTDRPPVSKPAKECSDSVRETKTARSPAALALHENAPAATETAGFDPYNSSGSFDRRKNWERIRKR